MSLPWEEEGDEVPEGRRVSRFVNYLNDEEPMPFGWLAAHYRIVQSTMAEAPCTCCPSRLLIMFVVCEASHEDAMPFLSTLDAVEALVDTWRSGASA